VQEALHKQGLLIAPRQRRETPCRLRHQCNPALKTPAARSKRGGRAARSAPTVEASTQDASGKIETWRSRASALLRERARCKTLAARSRGGGRAQARSYERGRDTRRLRQDRDVAVARKRAPTGVAAVRNALSLAATRRPGVRDASGGIDGAVARKRAPTCEASMQDASAKVEARPSRCARRSCRRSSGAKRTVTCDDRAAAHSTGTGNHGALRSRGSARLCATRSTPSAPSLATPAGHPGAPRCRQRGASAVLPPRKRPQGALYTTPPLITNAIDFMRAMSATGSPATATTSAYCKR